ncbi:zinc-dependent alcohol dehydrogenase family protein [Pseudarthrobacter sp. NPDC058329]|uniref:zinc-dependent alcohol dehydrogenase family protein n=1 Tax=Pseudarthrobacter sp. NPDC058329 TaxID=3346448 RepID=UPI0036DD94FC
MRIRTYALALNRADVMFRTGIHFFKPRLPQGQGLKAAGRIESLGPEVTGLAIGDAVSVIPAFPVPDYPLHGELVLAPARAVVKHPERLSFSEAAALWMAYSTAYGGLIDIAGLRAGETVVIPAASSSVGLAAIQIANLVGATPIALSRTRDKTDLLTRHGAANVITTGTEDVTERLEAITQGAGYDVLFDPVGGPLFGELASAAALYGRVILYGALSSELTPLPALTMLQKRLTIRGYDVVEVIGDDTRLAKAVVFINIGVQTGALTPTVAATMEFADIADAYRFLENHDHAGKVVINVPQGHDQAP